MGTRTTEWRNEKDRARGRAACIGLSHGASQLLHSQRRIPIDELSAVSQASSTNYFDKVTNKISNSPAQKPARHQVSLPDALPPPSSPTLPGSPILIGSRSEGLLMAENDAPLGIGEELTKRRASFVQHLATTADR
jgi:hypothetical protein